MVLFFATGFPRVVVPFLGLRSPFSNLHSPSREDPYRGGKKTNSDMNVINFNWEMLERLGPKVSGTANNLMLSLSLASTLSAGLHLNTNSFICGEQNAICSWGYGERSREESLSEDDYLIKRDFKGVLPAKPWRQRQRRSGRNNKTQLITVLAIINAWSRGGEIVTSLFGVLDDHGGLRSGCSLSDVNW